MQALKMIGLLLLAMILTIVATIIYQVAPRLAPAETPASIVTSFEECAAAGNPVMESYPRQCNTSDGRHFVEVLGEPIPSDGMTFNGCAVAGCSQQLCVSAEEAPTIITTCEFRDEYICYAEASCEPQADGTCGWTPTAELQSCLANPPRVQGAFDSEPQVQ